MLGEVAIGRNQKGPWCGLIISVAASVIPPEQPRQGAHAQHHGRHAEGTDVGSVKAWPSNPAEPLPSLVYFQKGGKIFGIANGISVPMCDEAATNPCQSGDITFKVVDSRVHLVVDVVGYFHEQPAQGGAEPPG